jgi:hypothetical protein
VRRGETQDHTKTKGDGLRVNPVSLSAKIHDQDAVMMRSSGILVSRLYKKTIETAASDPSDSYAQAATSDNDSEITRNERKSDINHDAQAMNATTRAPKR